MISWRESPLRRFLWLPVGYGMGISVFFLLPYEPSVLSLCVFFTLGLFILFLNWVRWRIYSLYFLAWVLMGLGGCGLRAHILDTFLLKEIVNHQPFKAVIHTIEDKDTSYRLYLDRVDLSKKSFLHHEKIHKVRLKASKNLFSKPPQEGDLLEGVMTLLPISGPIYPGGLDLKRQAYFEGISAYGSLKELLSIESQKELSDISIHLQRWRSSINHKFSEHLSKDSLPVAMALVTGDRSLIPQHVRQQFVDAGIAHILAISGLHLSLIAGFVFMTIRGTFALSWRIAERWNIKKIAAFIAILFTFLYLLISGAGYPAQRAFMMTTLVMIAIMVDRKAISMRTLAFAAFAVLLWQPESLLSASFQLSFSAVVALIAFYEVGWRPLYEWAQYGGMIRKSVMYVSAMILTTFIASLATTPFTIVFFNRLTLQSILGNILAIPLTGVLVMPTAFLSTLSLLWGGSSLMFWVFEESLKLLCMIAAFVSSLPGSGIIIPSPSPWYLVCVVGGGLWLCLWQTRWRLLGFLPILASFIFLFYPKTPVLIVSSKVMGIQKEETLFLSNNKGWYEKAMWQRHLGLHKEGLLTQKYEIMGDTLILPEIRDFSKDEIQKLSKNPQIKKIVTLGYFPKRLRQKDQQIFDRSSLKEGGPFMAWSEGNSLRFEATSSHSRLWN